MDRVGLMQSAELTTINWLCWTKDFISSKLSKLKSEEVADNKIFPFVQAFLIILEWSKYF